MPRLTARCLRMTATAWSMRARSSGSRPAMSSFDAADELAYRADFLLGRDCCCERPVVAAGGGEPFADAEQVVEVGGHFGQVGDVGTEVVAAGIAEPQRAVGAAGGDVGRLGAGAVGDGDRADGVAACSLSGSARASRQVRLPCRSNCMAVTLSMASRRRSSPTCFGGVRYHNCLNACPGGCVRRLISAA